MRLKRLRDPMAGSRRPRVAYANVTSTLALVIALSMGGAYAHGKIGSALIKDNAVKSRHIASGQVKTPDLGTGAVAAGKIKNGNVTGAKVGANAVTGPKVKDGSLGGQDFHPQADGLFQAGMWVDSGVVKAWFNRLGNRGAPTVTSPSAGIYHVTIPGAPNTDRHKLIAIASSRNYLRECRVMDATNGHITIYCSDNSDASLLATSFDLLVVRAG